MPLFLRLTLVQIIFEAVVWCNHSVQDEWTFWIVLFYRIWN